MIVDRYDFGIDIYVYKLSYKHLQDKNITKKQVSFILVHYGV